MRILKKKLIEHKRKAEITQNKNYYVGAITLDKKGNILSIGFNNYLKTHPYQKMLSEKHFKEDKVFLHAEISALIKCNSTPYALIVARIGKTESTFRIAKPCCICQAAIKLSSIKKVYFTNDQGELVLLNLSELKSE